MQIKEMINVDSDRPKVMCKIIAPSDDWKTVGIIYEYKDFAVNDIELISRHFFYNMSIIRKARIITDIKFCCKRNRVGGHCPYEHCQQIEKLGDANIISKDNSLLDSLNECCDQNWDEENGGCSFSGCPKGGAFSYNRETGDYDTYEPPSKQVIDECCAKNKIDGRCHLSSCEPDWYPFDYDIEREIDKCCVKNRVDQHCPFECCMPIEKICVFGKVDANKIIEAHYKCCEKNKVDNRCPFEHCRPSERLLEFFVDEKRRVAEEGWQSQEEERWEERHKYDRHDSMADGVNWEYYNDALDMDQQDIRFWD